MHILLVLTSGFLRKCMPSRELEPSHSRYEVGECDQERTAASPVLAERLSDSVLRFLNVFLYYKPKTFYIFRLANLRE